MCSRVHIAEDTGYNTTEKEQSKSFLKFVLDNFLTQLVSEPTRNSALLDLFLTNSEGLVGDNKAGSYLGHSDHELIEFFTVGEIRSWR